MVKISIIGVTQYMSCPHIRGIRLFNFSDFEVGKADLVRNDLSVA